MQAALFDLDGVVYQGEAPIEGAADAVRWLQDENIPHLFVTNTTSRPRSAIIDKLRRFGMDTDEARILTPPVAALHWLRANVNGLRVEETPALSRRLPLSVSAVSGYVPV